MVNIGVRHKHSAQGIPFPLQIRPIGRIGSAASRMILMGFDKQHR